MRDHRPAVAGAVTWLRQQGLAPGDRLVTLLANTHDTFALGLACMLEGVVQVPLPPDLVGDDLRQVVDDAEPSLVLVDPVAARDAVGVADRDRRRPPAEGWASLPPTDPDGQQPRTRPMAYTSGTIGRRKGVHVGVHDDRWGREVVDDEHAAFGHRHGDRHLVVSPLYHSGPFRFAAITALTGGRVEVMESFDVPTWQRLLREVRPTSLFCVPTHLHRLLSQPDTDADLFASLTLLAHAGAPCPVPLKERLLALAPDDVVWEFYGSTEGQFTVCPPDLWQRAPGTVGTARASRRLQLRDIGDDGVGTVWVEAAVTAQPGHPPDPDELQAFARERLRRAQVPRRVHVVGDLPRTPTGKVACVGLAEAVGR